jgi:spore maturation protein CgeB
VWTWHEAADVTTFYPRDRNDLSEDLVWIGNWGDEERTAEISEFLVEPVRRLGLSAATYGVRYPERARRLLSTAGIRHGGWLPNYQVPGVFAGARFTLHIPRRPYTGALPGIPTIRVFEALASGIPLVCSPWNDAEGLFTPGRDYLLVNDGDGMDKAMAFLLHEPDAAAALAAHGLATIRARHTCSHRVDELLGIWSDVKSGTPSKPAAAAVGG